MVLSASIMPAWEVEMNATYGVLAPIRPTFDVPIAEEINDAATTIQQNDHVFDA